VPIARLIFIKVEPERVDEALQLWKHECGPLMISVDGCLSEELLSGVDGDGELISYSVWRELEDIERYRVSDVHEQIKEHSRPLASDRPVVKLYEIAG
jgi:heme-degrading monooxygenase HmoA